MKTESEQTERAVAQGIQRQKTSEAAGSGTFVIVFLVIAAIGTFVCLQTNHASGWYVIAVVFGSAVIAGVASSRAARNTLNR